MQALRSVSAMTAVLMLGLAGASAQTTPRAPQPAAQATPKPAPQAAPQPAPPPVAPAKPYKPVAATPPKDLTDPGLEALRKALTAAAQKKDRTALGTLVVTKGFFWERESGNAADQKKSGIDNLATALGLANTDGAGWDMLSAYAEDPTGAPSTQHKGAICSPADPAFDGAAFAALLKSTATDVSDWGYPLSPNVEVRATPAASAPVTAKLALAFVRVMPEANPVSTAYVRVVTPDGKTGYAPVDGIAPIGNDQICYMKEGTAWKIGGYIGGGDGR